MERYFFHVEFGQTYRDEDGTEYATPAAAREAAVSLLGEMFRDEGARFWEHRDISVCVENASGLMLWRIQAFGAVSAAASEPGQRPSAEPSKDSAARSSSSTSS